MMEAVIAHESGMVVAPCAICGLYHAADVACAVALRLPARDAGSMLVPGELLAGRYEIVSIEHRSEMSTIYRARDRTIRGSTVAIKQVCAAGLSEDARAEARRWLAREAGLLSSLQNVHLPALLAAFSEDDNHYVVMPYLIGETLKERVQREGPQPEYEVTRWAAELLAILAYLHGQHPPVIHRDLKPDNILVPAREPPEQLEWHETEPLVLLDLGVARPLARGLAGTAIGTPGYAAPEQYQGLADERSDLYALGATLHFLLTAYDAEHEPPFRHPPVRQINPDVSPATEHLVANLLELAPEQRPAAVAVVQQELGRVQKAVAKRYLRAPNVVHGLYTGAAQVSWGLPLSAMNLSTAHAGTLNLISTLCWLFYCLLGVFTFVRAARGVTAENHAAQVARRTSLLVAVPLVLSLAYVLTGSTLGPLLGLDWIAAVLVCIVFIRGARATAQEIKQRRLQLTGGKS